MARHWILVFVGLLGCSGGGDGSPPDGGAAIDSAAADGSATDAAALDAGPAEADAGETCPPPAPPVEVPCADQVEPDTLARWTATASDGATTTLTISDEAVWGAGALRVDTESGGTVQLRYEPAAPLDASGAEVLHLAVRALNENTPGWRGEPPIVRLDDAAGARIAISPARTRMPADGETWNRIAVPLAGGGGWTRTDDPARVFDPSAIVAIEIVLATWDQGWWLLLDGVSFTGAGEVCAWDCGGCSGRGACLPAELRCSCELGAVGPDCGACGEGFLERDGHCALAEDGEYDEWPNPVSRANSDPWLVVHHEDVRMVRPKVLVLNFVNDLEPDAARANVQEKLDAIRESSRPRGYEDAAAAPQIEYDLVGLVDLRDGVDGRPPPPEGWTFGTGTLFPRRDPAEEGNWRVDYADFFGDAFAAHYGFADPEDPSRFRTLCELVDDGEIHELWFLRVPDDGDVTPAEVLELKPRYTPERNRLPGALDHCAGNGCFDADVPRCARMVRIVSNNPRRGPGCRLHTLGHNLEGTIKRDVVPSLTEWLEPFAGFDLDVRWSFPVQNLYRVSCGGGTCIEYPEPERLEILHRGDAHVAEPWDGVCGNVHFPPNGQSDYDYRNATPVRSSCESFGRRADACAPEETRVLEASTWEPLNELAPDCGGPFLVWWYQNMPAHGTGQRFADGRPMLSVWPFLFY